MRRSPFPVCGGGKLGEKMDNYFDVALEPKELGAISALGLAHIGDAVYELLVRSYLCCRGDVTVQQLHKDSVALVSAPAQADFVEALLPHLTEEEMALYRRGRNSHPHGVPKSASPGEYARATGLEALFGGLFLAGRARRCNELFIIGMEARHGL